jgi:hypothetical protein
MAHTIVTKASMGILQRREKHVDMYHLRCNAKREKQRHAMKMKCKTAVHITIIKKKEARKEDEMRDSSTYQ